MKHRQLKYDYIKAVDSWENPIAKDGFYDECQVAEFTGCWDDKDNYYEVMSLEDGTQVCIDSNGNECELPETDNWQEDGNTYLYYDSDSNQYFEQETNGNFWYQITKPVLIPIF